MQKWDIKDGLMEGEWMDSKWLTFQKGLEIPKCRGMVVLYPDHASHKLRKQPSRVMIKYEYYRYYLILWERNNKIIIFS